MVAQRESGDAAQREAIEAGLDAVSQEAREYAFQYRRTVGDPIQDLSTILQVSEEEMAMILEEIPDHSLWS